MTTEEDENKVTYEVDAKSVEDQTEASDIHRALHRKLKNRHVAMIRYVHPLPDLHSL